MNIKLIVLGTGEEAVAAIKEGKVCEMPSLQEGWRFDFQKHLKTLKNATGYLLARQDSPEIIEGCMIFQLIDKKMPYMSYLEVAPHNKGISKKHDNVAGSLIAYAFKISLIKGVEEYAGVLNFTVGEEKEEDKIKLMALYSQKYNAVRLSDTDKMAIYDADGEDLIMRYLS